MDLIISISDFGIYDSARKLLPTMGKKTFIANFAPSPIGETELLYLGISCDFIPLSARLNFKIRSGNDVDYKLLDSDPIVVTETTIKETIIYIPFKLQNNDRLDKINDAKLTVFVKAVAPDNSNQVQQTVKIKGTYLP